MKRTSLTKKLKTTSSCDLSVVETILQYYGRPYSARSLNQFLHKHSFGSLITEVAECLLSHGVTSTLVSANPSLFSRQAWEEFTFLSDSNTVIGNILAKEILRVIELGVLLKGQVPTIQLIEAELAKKQPVIISCNLNVLLQKPGIDFHYAVVAGFDQHHFILAGIPGMPASLKISKTILLFAIHSITTKNPLAGSILLTKKMKSFQPIE